MLPPNDLSDTGARSRLAHPQPPSDAACGETGRFENRFGASIVWLLFAGLALNIWPGWTRIAAWLP
jgi:hypothetical protein